MHFNNVAILKSRLCRPHIRKCSVCTRTLAMINGLALAALLQFIKFWIAVIFRILDFLQYLL